MEVLNLLNKTMALFQSVHSLKRSYCEGSHRKHGNLRVLHSGFRNIHTVPKTASIFFVIHSNQSKSFRIPQMEFLFDPDKSNSWEEIWIRTRKSDQSSCIS
ncbi:MAG TPA: hypothetical protein DIT94_00485 [Deltaproteobacteria bacterium]|nr:hypothetical protein [Deltaproteobacteria bacterium]HCP32827.1 hypothetical protein [Deltaproteobacteria bacterium]